MLWINNFFMNNINKIEKKWQDYWDENETFKTKKDSSKPKFFCLDMFPYPSGQGLHVGHPRGYVATDTFSHFKRMQGYEVLHPMGWDAFGLPAENYAIKTGVHPKKKVEENVKHFKKQLKSIGFSYDWSREINTTDPEYFKWTQWIFLKLFEKGLAYQDTRPINWCPSCKTGLANEEVVKGLCERCDAKVVKKDIRQWVLKITEYADRLLEDIDEVEWPEPIKEMQRNWIGRSEGATIKFPIKKHRGGGAPNALEVEVFTTRPDTLFGATFLVVAPEHFLVKKILSKEIEVDNLEEIKKYEEEARKKSELERTDLAKEKTGVEIKGLKGVNPINGEEIPVWVADYVLGFYGKGAVMSVPAHDERDYEIAEKYGLEIREVVKKEGEELPYPGEGEMVNSGEFSGLSSSEGKKQIIKKLEELNKGEVAVNYKLGDWVFSRQRYWGEPIPVVHCEKCGVVALEEKDLPLELPETEKYEPTGTGESPLADMKEWLKTTCPKCGGEAERETNTMPQWAGSCWYYLAFIMKQESEKMEFPASRYEDAFQRWLPVDLYVGGAEHAVLHLLYARFWHKVLYDVGVVKTKEPFYRLKNQGLIMGEGGIKMSKSKGNVVSPDEVIQRQGADVLRLYEMFLGGFEDRVAWSEDGVNGMKRFLEKVKEVSEKIEDVPASSRIETVLHQTIKKVTEDIENFKFNTAISSLMVMNNEMKKEEKVSKQVFSCFLKLLAPFTPHFAEEMWEKIGNKPSVLNEEWPKYLEEKTKEAEVSVVVQVNGKVRDTIKTETGAIEEEVKKKALESSKVKKWVDKEKIKKTIFVKDKLINFVI
jgi:leucyl-tRNA synthetase